MTSTEQHSHDNNDTHLWMAVMDRAVRDLVALERFKKENSEILEDPVFRYDYSTLKKWFYSKSMEPGAFNWICSLVNIDPSWALAQLEKRLNIGLKTRSKPQKPIDFSKDPKAIAA
ncbi:MAG: hypothetical protein HQL67_00840 [Magnetococcales bacterium]|nr:hypothetical protein [Magnetococcales bacterium]